jgi:SAM-dependent methyltransferase
MEGVNLTQGDSDAIDFGELVAFYERIVDPLTLPIGLRALDLLNIAAGDRLIDVAAGTGALAVEAARRGVHVMATDIEPKMMARAAARLTPYASAEARIASFDALGALDAAFDAAVSIAGVLSFPGGEAGLRELVRVTRPGGRIAVATWDQEQTAAPQYLASDVYAMLFPDRELWPASFFPVWTKDAAAAALREAGCTSAEVHAFEGEWTVTSPATVLEASGASIRMFPGYKGLSDGERVQFENAFVAAVTGQAGPDGVARITTRAFIVVGQLPD